MRIVAALGGNALQRRGEPTTLAAMRDNARIAAEALAPLAANELIITHGNGPQVGMLALQAAATGDATPFDVLGAESEGMIGYVLTQEFKNVFADRPVATILTQTVVDEADPAFARPTKPIGTVYPASEGGQLGAANGWTMVSDGNGVRRAIASPKPRDIVELPAIEALLDAGVMPICVGGGGVPVARDERGLHGVEAVIDKDRASALLATAVDADLLLLLTDVDAVIEQWGTEDATPIDAVTPDDLRALDLAEGSMGPKADAAAEFAALPGRRAAIGALQDAVALSAGSAGTQVRLEASIPV